MYKKFSNTTIKTETPGVTQKPAAQSCCITGHRDLPANQMAVVEQAVREAVMKAVDDGFTHFISGFADGVDLMFARIITELKKDNGLLTLEAAIPYRNRIKKLAFRKTSRELLQSCNHVTVVSEDYYPGCFLKRNRYTVNASGRVIAVYDGRIKGGTAYTVRFARDYGKDVRIISYLKSGEIPH